MATTYKVLGQQALSPTTNTDVYTVPSATSTVVSTVVICNRDTATAQYRLAVRPAGATISNEHYIAFDTSIAGNDSVTLTIGITLAATDVITAYSSASAALSVSVFGSEIS